LSQGTGKKILEILKKYEKLVICCGLCWDEKQSFSIRKFGKVHFVSHNDVFPFVNYMKRQNFRN
jgi:uncharacterized protein YlbG (UPF0298 family)